ncbi:MAG: biopolymer transporter ExbB [Planktomarina sp.]|nr:biopolymer transporter ExbB [Planktomarina sp.]MDT2032722.1 biopolymer transporter ExbB [Planktomarina sp.]MDT2039115.1 biopolymer transporter ExbB [Planktomarina sp.]|tara:strand:- start:8837 stop:10006 length:1170 start_codon:yes stop_codon:yes gene_type:complete
MDQIHKDQNPQFSQPFSQILTMMALVGGAGLLSYIAYPNVGPTFLANPYLNIFILFVFFIGVATCFHQVLSLIYSVQWIEGFASQKSGHQERKPPQLLLPLASLLRGRGEHMQLGSASSRSILDSVSTRIDEQRELTRYITNMLIFLGLLGTFYGLATTVPALVQTIQSLTPGENESAVDIFSRLQDGLEGQLDGMGIAFASSLLGLAGSLMVGLLEVFSSRGQNRFYGELEEWLSSITRVGFASGDGDGVSDQSILGSMMDQMSEQMASMARMYSQSSVGQTDVETRLIELTHIVEKLTGKLDQGQTQALERVAASQEKMLARMGENSGDGIDAESRMRLRSIDVQMLRVVEEISTGRQESISEIRSDLANLSKSIHSLAQTSPSRKE